MARRTLADDIKLNRPFQLPQLEVFLNLVRTTDRLTADVAALFKPHGITMQQYNVLRILRGAGPEGLPSLEVAHRMVTRVPDITRLVDRMAKTGLVVRDRCANDRRVVRIKPTAKGSRLASKLEEPMNERHRQQLRDLNERDLTELNRLLVKARQGVEHPAS